MFLSICNLFVIPIYIFLLDYLQRFLKVILKFKQFSVKIQSFFYAIKNEIELMQ